MNNIFYEVLTEDDDIMTDLLDVTIPYIEIGATCPHTSTTDQDRLRICNDCDDILVNLDQEEAFNHEIFSCEL